jgi:hypothetical protein
MGFAGHFLFFLQVISLFNAKAYFLKANSHQPIVFVRYIGPDTSPSVFQLVAIDRAKDDQCGGPCTPAATAADVMSKPPRPCSLPFQIPSFFTLSITLIFGRMHGALNVGKKK